jgi:hypothetical protein
MKPHKYHDSIRQCAAITGISEDDLKEWKGEGCPAFRHSRVYAAELTAWLKARRRKRPAASPIGAKPRFSLREHREYREQLRAKEIELRLAQKQGLLLVASELEVHLGSLFAAINIRLQQFASRTSRFLAMQSVSEIEAKLNDEMQAVLIDLNLCQYLDDPMSAIPQLPRKPKSKPC